MTVRRVRLSALLAGVSLSAAACSLTDPTVREGYWHPRGVNEGNLAAMVVDPHDLVQGRSSNFSDGTLAANAVDRLYRDKVRALPDTTLGVGGTSAAATAAGAADTTP
jgi:hypothetical protein